MEPVLLCLHAVTSVHVGAGQGIGLVDVPIARERITEFPVIPGSGLKGALRAHFQAKKNVPVRQIFGPESDAAEEFAAAIAVGDGRLAIMPFRSLAGTFSWATTPFILRRLVRDAEAAGLKVPAVPEPKADQALVANKTKVIVPVGKTDCVVLEEYDLEPKKSESAEVWADTIAGWIWPGKEGQEWKPLFKERFAILAEGAFNHLVKFGTEVVARVRIDQNTGTVAENALWYEESMPAESVFVAFIGADGTRDGGKSGPSLDAKGVLNALFGGGEFLLRLGGKQTVGKGVCRVIPISGR